LRDAFAYATQSLPPTRSECDVGVPPKRADDYHILHYHNTFLDALL
jgi:hypothetical protein